MPTRLLLIEDDERLAQSLCAYLERYLYVVTAVSTVGAACEAIAAAAFDVIVQDWILPDGDGRAVLEFARRHAPETAVVVYSAHASSDAESTAAGAHQFVEKSTDIGRLRYAIVRSMECVREFHSGNKQTHSAFQSFRQWLGDNVRRWGNFRTTSDGNVLTLVGHEILAAAVAESHGRSTHPNSVFKEVDLSLLPDSHGSVATYLFGSCLLQGRESSVTRGLLDNTNSLHLHVRCSTDTASANLERLVELARSQSLRRCGSQQDIDFQGLISLSLSEESASQSGLEEWLTNHNVPATRLPRRPLDMFDRVAWCDHLQSFRPSVSFVEVLAKAGVFECWRHLFNCVSVLFRDPYPDAVDLTDLPLFEQLFKKEHGELSTWKEIADIPRFLYTSWLLCQTGGNVAEASRVGKLSRPAIYAAVANMGK